MNNLRYAIDSIVRSPIKMLLIIIQIIIATTLLLRGLTISITTIDTINRSKNLYEGKEVYRLNDVTSFDKMNTIYADKDIEDKEYELYNYFQNNEIFNICAQNDSNIIIKDFSDKDEFCYNIEEKIMTNPYTNVKGNYNNVKGFYIDIGYNSEFPFEVKQGRMLNDKDFEPSEETKVILGSDYEGIFEIGDEFEYFDFMNLKTSKIKVVGILKEHTYVYFGGGIVSLDDRVICPLNRIDKKYDNVSNMFFWWITNSFIVTDDEKQTIKDIRSKCSELYLYDYNVKSIQKSIDSLIEYLKKDSIKSILLSLIIFLFISVGIVTVQLNEIEEKTKEYGVHLLAGANKKDILRRTNICTLIYLLVGMSAGSYIYFLDNGEYNIKLFIFTVISMLLFASVISYFPAKKIKKMQITSYIKGERE